MKRIVLLISVFLTAILLTGCNGKITSYQEIKYDKLIEMFEDKEDFVLFIGSSQCSHCQSYKPKLEAIIKVNQIKVYYIDVNELSNDENEALERYVPYSGTPYTVFIEDGKVKENGTSIVGDHDIDYIKKVFQKNGYIKE